LDHEQNIVEKYPSKLEAKDRALTYKWVLWEQFQQDEERDKKKKNFDDKFVSNMRKVGYFNSIFQYCKLQHAVPHFDLLNFFYDYIRQEQHT